MTNLDNEAEPYILTPDEEAEVWDNACRQQEDHYRWVLNSRGVHPLTAEAELKAIDWTKDPNLNRDELLKRANSFKHQAQWHKQRLQEERQAEKEQAEKYKKFWTAGQFYKYMAWQAEDQGKKLITNDDTLPLIKTICYFLSEDPRFETELGLSFRKGLMLRGPSGLGKTDLVKWVSDNQLHPVTIFSMIRIAETVKDEGEFEIKGGTLLYLDDVGTEEAPVNHYGTKINWFKDFIELYYNSGKQHNRLIISTNLPFDDLEAKYGYRVRSRIREMFNVVDVKGEDLRG